jgi:hypothetical protein
MQVIKGYFDILRAIRLEAISMEFIAIHLEPDQPIDYKVDALKLAETDLTLHSMASKPESGSGQALRK